ncbi:MAG TPA: hypothetical protein DCE55_17015, partial [Planctomycetaceae bacterium]|nr:hypothetical protein [Planctomycetaceae bacterium]
VRPARRLVVALPRPAWLTCIEWLRNRSRGGRQEAPATVRQGYIQSAGRRAGEIWCGKGLVGSFSAMLRGWCSSEDCCFRVRGDGATTIPDSCPLDVAWAHGKAGSRKSHHNAVSFVWETQETLSCVRVSSVGELIKLRRTGTQ